jgi:hypothetical protein
VAFPPSQRLLELSNLTWPGDLEEDVPEVDIPLVEEQPAMASMKLGAGAASFQHTHGWGEGQDYIDPANFQRAVDEHVKEAWKEAFAPMAGTSAEDQNGVGLVFHAPLDTTPIA